MKIVKILILYVFLPSLVLFTDFSVRSETLSHFNSKMQGYYLLSVAGSFLFYLSLLLFLNQLARKVSKKVIYFISFGFAIA